MWGEDKALQTEIAPNVVCLSFTVSNVYLVGETEGPWVVVDSGTPGHFEAIKAASEERYGANAKPAAIILTHGHFDHYGSALPLATYWNVPVYAHRLDLPYLTGKATMPPIDPTVGGFFALVSRLLPDSGTDFGDTIHALPDNGSVPGMPGWQWIATPGHTPGHVSLFRESDRVLLAGDAVLTVNMDEFTKMATKQQELSVPPKAITSDWVAARRSINALADLHPLVIASGHGIPMSGPELPGLFRAFADDFMSPLHGRYVAEPAITDENGIVFLPPPAPDPLPKYAAVMGIAAATLVAAYVVGARQRKRNTTL